MDETCTRGWQFETCLYGNLNPFAHLERVPRLNRTYIPAEEFGKIEDLYDGKLPKWELLRAIHKAGLPTRPPSVAVGDLIFDPQHDANVRVCRVVFDRIDRRWVTSIPGFTTLDRIFYKARADKPTIEYDLVKGGWRKRVVETLGLSAEAPMERNDNDSD